MRVFLALCSMTTLLLAKPQNNYSSGISGNFGSSAGNSNNVGPTFGGFTSTFQNDDTGGSLKSRVISGYPSFGSDSLLGSRSNDNGLTSTSSTNYNQYSQQHQQHQQHQQQSSTQFETPLVYKQFITISAPEDTESLQHTKHLVIGRPQKNYRVIFIKAPSSNNANVKLSAEYAPQEEKTVIYILSKNDNSLEIGDIGTPAPTVPSKPEIFFVKYKTEEEAQHAQKQIQAEYDKIDGVSEHIDGGIAFQQSVIGIFDGTMDNSRANIDNGGNAGNYVATNSGSLNTFTGSSSRSIIHNNVKTSTN